jgi:hypothetical protein
MGLHIKKQDKTKTTSNPIALSLSCLFPFMASCPDREKNNDNGDVTG